jgi:hypothetical protein
MDRISTANGVVTNDKAIADEFNSFFSEIGLKISNYVNPSTHTPDEYLHNTNPVPLSFGTFTQAEFISIINALEPKASSDIDGISKKLIKFIKFEIDTPLVHIFNLSLKNGTFPSKLKTSRTVPIFKLVTNFYVIIIVRYRSCLPSQKS